MQKKIKILNHSEVDVHEIEYLICQVASLWRKLVGDKIKSLGLTVTDKRVLFSIMRHPGFTQIQIANLLELEPQNLMRSLDKLEEQGYLNKCTDPSDRRVKCLTITAQGQKIISQIQTITKAMKSEVLAGLDNKKLGVVMKNLTTIRENLFSELGGR